MHASTRMQRLAHASCTTPRAETHHAGDAVPRQAGHRRGRGAGAGAGRAPLVGRLGHQLHQHTAVVGCGHIQLLRWLLGCRRVGRGAGTAAVALRSRGHQGAPQVGGIVELGQAHKGAGCGAAGAGKVAAPCVRAVVFSSAGVVPLQAHPHALLAVNGADVAHCGGRHAPQQHPLPQLGLQGLRAGHRRPVWMWDGGAQVAEIDACRREGLHVPFCIPAAAPLAAPNPRR